MAKYTKKMRCARCEEVKTVAYCFKCELLSVHTNVAGLGSCCGCKHQFARKGDGSWRDVHDRFRAGVAPKTDLTFDPSILRTQGARASSMKVRGWNSRNKSRWVHLMKENGISTGEISSTLGIDRKTVWEGLKGRPETS